MSDIISKLAGATKPRAAAEAGKSYLVRLGGLTGKVASNGTPMLRVSFEHAEDDNKNLYDISTNIFKPTAEQIKEEDPTSKWSSRFKDKAVIAAVCLGAGIAESDLSNIDWSLNSSDEPNERGYVRASLVLGTEPVSYGALRKAKFSVFLEAYSQTKQDGTVINGQRIGKIRVVEVATAKEAADSPSELD